MRHRKEKLKGKGKLILMLSEKEVSLYLLITKQKFPSKVVYLKKNKKTIQPFNILTHIQIA